MTADDIRFRIMSQATEDFTGLWELAAARGAPAVDDLVAVLEALIREGLVAIYSGTRFASEEQILPAEQASLAIRDRRFWNWTAPDKGPHLRAFATAAGSDWYFAQHGKPHHTSPSNNR